MRRFLEKNKKRLGSIALICVMIIVLLPEQVYADTKFKLNDFAQDSDTSFSTIGTLQDSTTLTININSWWYGKSYVESEGVSSCSFGKKNTNYTCEFVSHTISTYMSGVLAEATISGSPSVTLENKDNIATYTCTDMYWSYHIKTTARCWTATYEQQSTARYKIMSGGKSIATVDLLTVISW